MGSMKQMFGVIQPDTYQQIENCLSLEELSLGVLCADSHPGYTMPIGGVLATKNIVIPSGVGFDIGCGNLAVRTNIKGSDLMSDVPRLMDEIVARISFGVGRTNNQKINLSDWSVFDAINTAPLSEQRALMDIARTQFGTVGSGNHYVDLFVEDDADVVWVGVHFGSRGFGYRTAEGFLALGQGLSFFDRPAKNAPVVTFEMGSALGESYLSAMRVAGLYAHQGREYVVAQVLSLLGATSTMTVHNHHNYAWTETHFGETYLVTRKGATPAHPGQLGFVGGSMGDHAVILEGVESEQSKNALYSTVHGAGRAMSRGEAKRSINWSDVLTDLQQKGIELRGAAADEAPGAYKRLPEVLAYHAETVKILHTLRPVGVAMAGKIFDPYKD